MQPMPEILPCIPFGEAVRSDLTLHTDKPFSWFSVFTHLRRPSFCAVFLFRAGAACYRKGRVGKLLSLILARINLMLHACEIAPGAVIGPRFHMPHPIGVVIGVSIIGRNAVILPNVCIGLKMPSEKDADDPTKYPQLGDDVFVSTGAVLLGAIKIGNRAIIGANSVVLSNVPDDYVAVGVPAHARAKRVKD